VRPALAHDEIVAPADYPRFAKLDVTPVLSFQWAKPAPDTVGALKDYPGAGALRARRAAGAAARRRRAHRLWQRLAGRSARRMVRAQGRRDPHRRAGRRQGVRRPLTAQPGMPRAAVLRAITLNAAYTLRQEALTGSLEVGKLADLIVLDRNFFTIPAEDIANIKVLQTVVGGKIVYQAKGMR
jgi:predicted amidohydrolase YtcJ